MQPEGLNKPLAEVDPRYQAPLEPGWWKTADGWTSILKSHRIDRRAKPEQAVAQSRRAIGG